MHDAGKQVEIGKFLLEDGKVLTLARKLSPSRNCVGNFEDPCGWLDHCCGDLQCDGRFNGRCHDPPNCVPKGERCGKLNYCCWPATTCSEWDASAGG
ncbi:hypothetical protein Tco_0287914, partial [Tanacetum coccineum]